MMYNRRNTEPEGWIVLLLFCVAFYFVPIYAIFLVAVHGGNAPTWAKIVSTLSVVFGVVIAIAVIVHNARAPYF